MGFLNKLFGTKPTAPATTSGAGAAAYSLVKDETGAIVGLWLADPQDADASRKGYIEVLLVKHGAPHLTVAPRRVVPNRIDKKGGCFVMFNSQRAPGE